MPSCSSTGYKAEDTKCERKCFENDKPSTSCKYIPPKKASLSQNTSYCKNSQAYNQFDSDYHFSFQQSRYFDNFHANTLDGDGYR